MRFLAHQTRARRQSWGLSVLFILLLLGLVVAICALVLLAYWSTDISGFRLAGAKTILIVTALSTAAIVLGAAFYEHLTLHSQGAIAIAAQLGGRLLTANRLQNNHDRQLLNVVHEVAIAAQHKPPLIYVLDNETSINAFAAGTESSYFLIGVTQGALELLDRNALQAVIAHEMSHIIEGDAALNMQLASLNYGLTAIHRLGCVMTASANYQPVWYLDFFAWMFQGVGFVGVCAGRVLQAAISREREYLADAGAVQLTRNPLGLVAALRSIAKQATLTPMQAALHSPYSETFGYAFFCTAYAQAEQAGSWLDTHPPIHQRIRRLLQG